MTQFLKRSCQMTLIMKLFNQTIILIKNLIVHETYLPIYEFSLRVDSNSGLQRPGHKYDKFTLKCNGKVCTYLFARGFINSLRLF